MDQVSHKNIKYASKRTNCFLKVFLEKNRMSGKRPFSQWKRIKHKVCVEMAKLFLESVFMKIKSRLNNGRNCYPEITNRPFTSYNLQ